MEFANLQAFVAIAESGSFSQASERLHLTQPAISKRIAALEQELDVRLFDRFGRTVALTEAGQALWPRARQLLLDSEDIRRDLTRLSGTTGGRLVLATSHHIGLHRLPELLRDFTRRYPDVQLDLRFMDSEAGCRAVETGEIELAIVTLPDHPDRGLHTEPVWADPLVVVVPGDHPLAGRKRVTAATLSRHDAILPAQGTFTRSIIENAFAAEGHPLSVTMSTNYLETLKMLVSVGLGWSILPKTMLSPPLHALTTTGLSLQRTLGLVWHRRRTLSNAAMALIPACRQRAG